MVHKFRSGAVAVCLTLAAGGAYAQTPAREPADAAKYPSRLVRMTVGFTAGGAVDVSGRIIAQRLSEALERLRG